MQHFWKFVNTFYKNHPDKLTATSPLIDLAPPVAKHTVPPNVNSKQKRSRPVGSIWKKMKH